LQDADLDKDEEYDIKILNINEQNDFYLILLNNREELMNFQEKINSEILSILDENPKIGDRC
jgi:hypothetical protein